MVSRILSPLISQYLGAYVKDGLDADQLNLGLHKGDIELRDVHLNTQAINTAILALLPPDVARLLPLQLDTARLGRLQIAFGGWGWLFRGGDDGGGGTAAADGEEQRFLVELHGLHLTLLVRGDSHIELQRACAQGRGLATQAGGDGGGGGSDAAAADRARELLEADRSLARGAAEMLSSPSLLQQLGTRLGAAVVGAAGGALPSGMAGGLVDRVVAR
eukprot:g7710.t1